MIYDYFKEKNKSKFRVRLILAAILLGILTAIGLSIAMVMELLEIREIGAQYVSVYWTNFSAKYLTMLFCFIVIFLAVFVTNAIINKTINKIGAEEKIPPAKLPNASLAFIFATIGSLMSNSYLYEKLLVYLNSTQFSNVDPIFGHDIGYYILQRPFLMNLTDFLMGLMLAIIVYTAGYYILAFGALFNGVSYKSLKQNKVLSHNIMNIVVFFLLKAFTYKFQAEGVLYSKFVGVDGAGYTDIMIRLSAYRIMPYLIIGAIIFALVFIERQSFKKALLSIATVPVFWIITYIIIGAVQVFLVSPNEKDKEKPYLDHNMKYTKQGYNLNIEEKGFDVKPTLTEQTLKDNERTINNIRVTDYNATLGILNQIQAIRGYYKFNDTDIETYNINGTPTAVFVGAREIDNDNLNDKKYINRKFQYTHGFGVVMNSVNQVNPKGQPEFIIKDIKPSIQTGDIKITQPRIYYGELTNDYAIVNGKGINEIDYPQGDTNQEYRYQGNSGIKLNLFNRILMSAKYGDIQMLVSNYINSNSKLLINRNITDRVQKIAPFLKIDKDPYIVINKEGKLYWVVDAYTTSSYYPYSQHVQIGNYESINYIRNSVKVLVNAYDGSLKFYIVDRHDPIIMAYRKIYPAMFADIDNDPIPDDVWEHIRYPEKLYNIQAEVLKKYHVNDVDTFFRNEDNWSIAQHHNGNEKVQMEPYYTLIKLPGNIKEELVLMLPYTPKDKNNLIAWLGVRSTRENYGKMVLYRFPKDVNILGPLQLDNLIDQNPDISKDLALWNQGGSKVLRRMSIIPVENTLLYVEPIYIAAMNEGAIPEVKKVIVAYDGEFAIGDTLQQALLNVINKTGPTIPIKVEDKENIKSVLEQTFKTYRNLKDSSSKNDWESFGKDMQKLDELLQTIENRQNEITVKESPTVATPTLIPQQ